MVVLKELIFHSFHCWEGVMVLTELISLTVSTLGGCGGPDRTDL